MTLSSGGSLPVTEKQIPVDEFPEDHPLQIPKHEEVN